MKIKRINTAILLLALAGMTLTGCSNEDLANVTPQEEGTGNVSFSIVEKDYEPADDTPKSRAAIEETKPEIQDLGDGLIAEVSLVPDTTHRVENPKTRAINTPTHYTIQAYQGGVKKGELKGTFNGSTFTPDAGQPKSISLPHGTYDFVCFNDKVSASGTQFTVNRSDAATARFTVQRGVVINPVSKQQVTFTMKHAGAQVNVVAWYVNFALSCKTTSTQVTNEDPFNRYVQLGETMLKGEFVNPSEIYQGTLETPANTVPEKVIYDFATDTYSYPTNGQISKSCEPSPGGQKYYSWSTPGDKYGVDRSNLLTDYWLPTTDCSKLKLSLSSGEFYGRSLVGKTITVPETKQVEANKQYLILIRLYINDQYLYSDGTAGPLEKNHGKPVVGVIFNPYEHMAIALHDAKVGGSDQIQWSNATTTQESYHLMSNYSEVVGAYSSGFSSGAAVLAARGYGSPMSGVYWNIPSFWHYLRLESSQGRMFESGNAYKQAFRWSYAFVLPDRGTYTPGFPYAASTINFPDIDITRFNQAFTKVGGTPPSGTYWTNSEIKEGTEYKMATITFSGNKIHLDFKSKTETAKVRPFMQY